MSKIGKRLFSGSRFIFWSLIPCLALCAVAMPFLVRKWTLTNAFWIISAEFLLLAFTLTLLDPLRFRWATRCMTAVVFCLFLVYAAVELFYSGQSLEISGSRAEVSPRNAILGLIAIGLPCLWYTLFGRFSLRVKKVNGDGAPTHSDKIDALDLDIR